MDEVLENFDVKSFYAPKVAHTTKTYENIECSMYDKDGKVLYSFEEPLGTLESLESKEIKHQVDIDLTKVANVEYVLK